MLPYKLIVHPKKSQGQLLKCTDSSSYKGFYKIVEGYYWDYGTGTPLEGCKIIHHLQNLQAQKMLTYLYLIYSSPQTPALSSRSALPQN